MGKPGVSKNVGKATKPHQAEKGKKGPVRIIRLQVVSSIRGISAPVSDAI